MPEELEIVDSQTQREFAKSIARNAQEPSGRHACRHAPKQEVSSESDPANIPDDCERCPIPVARPNQKLEKDNGAQLFSLEQYTLLLFRALPLDIFATTDKKGFERFHSPDKHEKRAVFCE